MVAAGRVVLFVALLIASLAVVPLEGRPCWLAPREPGRISANSADKAVRSTGLSTAGGPPGPPGSRGPPGQRGLPGWNHAGYPGGNDVGAPGMVEGVYRRCRPCQVRNHAGDCVNTRRCRHQRPIFRKKVRNHAYDCVVPWLCPLGQRRRRPIK